MEIEGPCKICLVGPMCRVDCKRLVSYLKIILPTIDVHLKELRFLASSLRDRSIETWINYTNAGYLQSVTVRYPMRDYNCHMYSIKVKRGKIIEILRPKLLRLPF